MIFGFVGIVSACLALPVAPVIAVATAITAMVVFTKLVIMWIEDYQETVDLYFRALDGDIDAANKLNGKAFLATVSMFFDFATGGFDGSKGAGRMTFLHLMAEKQHSQVRVTQMMSLMISLT